MNNNEDNDEYTRPHIFKIILISIVLFSLLWVNYCHFSRHIASNPEYINHFTPKNDDLDSFRVPAVAGLFYPAATKDLSQQVEKYLSSPAAFSTSRPQMFIVPHAGYQYSAETAAKAYRLLKPYASQIRNVFLIGPSHHVLVNGYALSHADYFQTPLGKISVNHVISSELAGHKNINYNNQAHAQEHSIEVQLPFLQKTLKEFKIIPIVYNNSDPQVLADALLPYLNRSDSLFIFSADLSHYYTYKQALLIDDKTKELIAKKLPQIEDHMSCGSVGINTALLLAQKNNLHPRLLELTNSGAVTGDKNDVVGYGAWSFDQTPDNVSAKDLPPLEQEVASLRNFAELYGQQLLAVSEVSLDEALKGKKYQPSRRDYPKDLFNRGASFVTLKLKDKLRGCIGSLLPKQAVADDIALNTYRAALEDSRFSPLTQAERRQVKVSISLLTDFEEIKNLSEEYVLKQIISGVDGIVIRAGDRQGVFLPAVWQEFADKPTFLNNLKVKAGMSPSYWSTNIKVYRFRVVEVSKDEN